MSKPLIPGGYVMLPRQIIEDEIWDKPPLYLKVWLYILQRAQHSEYNNMKRGETHISIPEIIEACSWKVGYRTVRPKKDEVYQAIDWMRKKSDTKATPNSTMEATPNPTTIATTKATHGLFVKVLHYGFFQDSKNYESNAERNAESNNESTYEEDTTPSNINKNVKNAKNDKNVKKEKERTAYGSFVTLTDEEKEKLNSQFGSPTVNRKIERMNEYCTYKGKGYKDYYRTLLNWLKEDEPAKPEPTNINKKKPKTEYEKKLNFKEILEERLSPGYEYYEERNQLDLYERTQQELAEVNEWLGKQEGRNNDEQLRSYQLTGTH